MGEQANVTNAMNLRTTYKPWLEEPISDCFGVTAVVLYLVLHGWVLKLSGSVGGQCSKGGDLELRSLRR